MIIFLFSHETQSQKSIAYNKDKSNLEYAINSFQSGQNYSINVKNLNETVDIKVFTVDDTLNWTNSGLSKEHFSPIEKGGYLFKWSSKKQSLFILAKDDEGAANGIFDLKSELFKNDFRQIQERVFKPSMEYRIIKFNLPWSPYRNNEATTLHYDTCRDLKFWQSYLDMMVENRFNVLSLWNIHPFSYMIKSNNFPLANSFSPEEMKEWKTFWKSLFKMAKDRNIETFIVNWNIAVSPEFAASYGVEEYSDLSDIVKQYTKESVTQVINEYPNLTGIGVTLADWMGTFDDKMTPQEREDWIEETFITGMNEAKRPIKFLHRSVLAGDPMAMRNLLDRANLKEPALVEIKFNWSHGHSTPKLAITHDYHSGKLDERFWQPKPKNYNIQWMIRNEDFFILRWGQPDFIRAHLAENSKDYVNGYFIGSEGYIPAKDYSHINSSDKNWNYAFQKQWLFYQSWGKLLYNNKTPDSHFEESFSKKYGRNAASPLFKAYSLVSKMPLNLASFHRSTWDYTLYSEGFIEAEPSSPNGSFDRSSPFISIDELINHETLNPLMISIPEYVNMFLKNQTIVDSIITPVELANELETDSKNAINELQKIKDIDKFPGLKSEIQDAQTWASLGLYFANKIRGGIALQSFRKTGNSHQKNKAINLLKDCQRDWEKVVQLTEDRYLPVPHVATEHYEEEFSKFSWKAMLPEVEKDIQIAQNASYK